MSPEPSPPRPSRAARSRARARRPRLDVDALVDRALAILDAEGLDAVTMRRLAAEFDTGPATLYSHVQGRDELLGLALQRIMAEIRIPRGDDWRDVVRGWCHEQRAVFSRHRDAARLCFGAVPMGESMLEGLEHILELMLAAGVPRQVAAWAIDAMTLYITADVYEGSLMATQFDDGSGRPPGEVGMEHFQQVGAWFRSLDHGRYPAITSSVDALVTGDGDDRFAFGVDTFIAGIEARIPGGPPAD